MTTRAARATVAVSGVVLLLGLASPAHAATSVTVTDKPHDARHGGAYAGASPSERKLAELLGFTVSRASAEGGFIVVIRWGDVQQKAPRRYDQSFEFHGYAGHFDLTVDGYRNQRRAQFSVGPASGCTVPVTWDPRRNTSSFTVRQGCLNGNWRKMYALDVSVDAQRPRTYRTIGYDYADAPGGASVGLGPRNDPGATT